MGNSESDFPLQSQVLLNKWERCKTKTKRQENVTGFHCRRTCKGTLSQESSRPDFKHLFTDVGTAAHRGFGVTGLEQP